jgi:hypothetical protein
VTPATLTITADADANATNGQTAFGKTYGTMLNFTGKEFTTSGLVNGDSVSSVSLSSTGAGASATVAGSPYPVTINNAQGSGLPNYTISYVNGSLTVSPKALTVTADADANAANGQTAFGKTYGTMLNFTGKEFTTSGLVNSDTVTSVSLASPGAAATATVASSPYGVTISNAQGSGLMNYTISYVSGTLNINPANLTITADADANAANGQTAFSKSYGQALTFAGSEFTTSGLVNSDSVSSVSLSSTGAGASATVAGSPYTVTINSAQGSGLSNYTISYVNGSLTVSPKALTITADADANAANGQTAFSKSYGQTLTFAGSEFTTSGLVNGDTVTSVSLASPGAAATATVAGSPYQVTINNAQGSGLTNYMINYVYGTLTITKDGTTTTGTLSAASLSFGQTLTVTATVTGTAPGSGTPTGLVDFYDTTTATDLGPVSLSSGMASVNVADLPVGTNTLTLSYLGDNNFLTSSTTVTATIAPSILVLHPTASGALSLSGNATISLAGNVMVDSNSASALTANGNAVLKAASIQVMGKVQKSGNATLSPAPLTGAAGWADPLAQLAAPSPSGLTNYKAVTIAGNSVQTLQPGIYSQITIAGNASVTLMPGVYILAGGGFTVSGNANVTVQSNSPSPVTGAGIVLYNTGSKYPNGGNYGAITVSGNGTVKLSPATIGVYAGLLIDQDPNNTQTLTLSGNALALTGIVYAPKAQVVLSGNAQLHASLDVDLLTVSGNAVDNGASPPGGGAASTRTPMPTSAGQSALGAGPAVGAGLLMSLDGTGPTLALVDASYPSVALPTRGATGTASVEAQMLSRDHVPVEDNLDAWWLPARSLEQVAAQDALFAAFAKP